MPHSPGNYTENMTPVSTKDNYRVLLGGSDQPSKALQIRLRIARRHKKRLQAELAEKIDLAASTLSHFEAGRRVPNLKTLYKLAVELDVSIDYLLGRTDSAFSHVRLEEYLNQGEMSLEDLNLMRIIAERLVAAPRPGAEFPPSRAKIFAAKGIDIKTGLMIEQSSEGEKPTDG